MSYYLISFPLKHPEMNSQLQFTNTNGGYATKFVSIVKKMNVVISHNTNKTRL